jgi:4-methylaminobutanoate oxidase (formaldehyde-forming)
VRDIVEPLTTDDVSNAGFPYLTARPITIGRVPVLALRVTYVGELGWELYAGSEFGPALWDTLIEHGRDHGLVPGGYRAIDALRLEKGYRVWSSDITPDETPFEAGLGFAVALDKGVDFAGKERLRRVAADPPNRLVTVKVEGDTLPEYGATVTKDGEEVGVLTSPTESPRFGRIGLAIVRAAFASPGTTLDVAVAVADGTATATVDVLPLYDTEKMRPRA